MAAAAPAKRRPPARGDASAGSLNARLRRIEGQVRGLERMIEEERDYVDVLTQISAVKGALDGVALELFRRGAHRYVAPGSEGAAGDALDGLTTALLRAAVR